MANSFIGIDEPATIDKKVDTEQLVVGANTIERERMQVAGATDVAIASVVNAAPSAEYGLVTRNIPSGTQAVSATDLDIRNLVPAQDEVQARDKAQFDDVAPTLPAEDAYADLRITANRDLRTNLRNAAGSETGVAATPLRTDPTGTTTQPVSDAGGALTVDAVDLDIRNLTAATDTVVANAGTGTFTTDPIDRAGRLVGQVEGRAADGVAVAGNPVLIAGQDGTLAQSIKTDAAGELQVDVLTLPALVAGAANIGDVDIASPLGAGTEAAAVRVTVATDSTGLLSVDDNGSTLTVDAPVGTPVAVRVSDGAAFVDVRGGDVAHDAVDSGNPVKIGAKAAGALPTAVAALDRVDAYFDREGRQIVRPWGAGEWTQVNFPAANTRASSTKAAGAAGVRHLCTGITVVLAAGATAPTAVQLDVRLRDGILDTGTILWQSVITLPATAGAMNGISRSGLHIKGTAATAMTLEFSAAGGANTFESVSFEGVDISEA